MKPVKINPELGKVKERLFMGLELWQIGNLLLAVLVSLVAVLLLPDMGMLKGVLSAIPAFPFVLVAVKPIYGLQGLQLVSAFLHCIWNSRPLRYESEEWKGVNKHC